MNCRSAESLFSAFVEDELSQRERRALESHLEACSRCAGAVRDLSATVELLTALPSYETGPAFEEEVMDRIRSGEALRPSLVEWLSERIAPVRLRPVFLAGATGCAVWIAAMIFQPFPPVSPSKNAAQLAGNTAQAPAATTPDAPAAGRVAAPAPPAGDVVASTSGAARVTPVSSGAAPAAVQTASSGADSARIEAPYQDEYILDQFYLNRSGEEGVHSIVPVSGRPTDDVYITF